MATETTIIPKPEAPAAWWKSLTLGPGLVFVLAAVGPQDLVVNTTAGAGFGYALLWTVGLIVVARFILLEATARYVVVTGETLMAGYARAGKWVVWVVLISVLVKRHLSGLYQLLLLGSSIHMFAPLPVSWSSNFWALASWAAGFSMMYWGRYELVEKYSKPLAVLLGGSLLVVAVAARPDLGAAIHGAVIPSIPKGYGYSAALVILALIGSGSGSMSNLKYAAFVHEKGWRSVGFLRSQRIDLLLSGIGLYAMLVMMQVAAAGIMYPSATKLKEVDDLLPMFEKALGGAGRYVLGIGIWSAVFTTYVGATAGYSMIVSDIYYNVMRRPANAQPGEIVSGHSNRPAYRWTLLWFCLSPIYVLLTNWEPLFLVLVAAASLALLLPLMTCVLLWLTTRRDLMREYANGPFATALMVCIALATAYLAYQNALELWGQL